MLSLSREQKCFIVLDAALLTWRLLTFEFELGLVNKMTDMEKYFLGLSYREDIIL